MFRERKGQQELTEYFPLIRRGDCLSIQWPTGYGKSIGFAMTWRHVYSARLANRFLLVVANDTQRQQVINDFAGDCKLVGAPCQGKVWSFERSGADIQAAMTGVAEVFVCTVQQLMASFRGGVNTLKDLLTTPRTTWMIGFDEFHHYGEDMPWGDAAKMAMQYAAFTLAMSATPYRRSSDVIFPEPRQVVTYAKAVEEKAAKAMICHSYNYQVTVEDGNGETNYTTSQLLRDAPDGLDAWEERRNIRYSPQYIHPLILHPLTRLMQKRAETGQRLQMLIRAMTCSHAAMVCEQVQTYAGDDLAVDWIGTGARGRGQDLNDRIRRDFCPPKQNGVRPEPTLDVLVQVNMAGEGFDSINVAEIVDIFPVSVRAATGRATTDKQFYGRGSRIIPKAPNVTLHISVPTDHPLHVWAGKELHRWMDSCGEDIQPRDEDVPREAPDIDLFEFPEFPRKREIELLNITTENEHFVAFAKESCRRRGYVFEQDKDELFSLYCSVAVGVAEKQSEQARLVHARDALTAITKRIGLILAKQRFPNVTGAAIGECIKEVNKKINRRFDKVKDDMMVDELELAYTWCQDYLRSLRGKQ